VTGPAWDNPLWQALLPLGRDDSTGGYRRYSFTEADSACRDWFLKAATQRNLRTDCDRNGNLWAWWDVSENHAVSAAGIVNSPPAGSATPCDDSTTPPASSRYSSSTDSGKRKAIVTGSHLDSVPDGGAFDGPLGVVSGFAAIDLMRERGCRPVRAVGVVAFVEEEGARFGVACLGSRLLTGVAEPEVVRKLTDADGVSLAQAMSGAGLDPRGIGAEGDLGRRVAAFVELHVEQGSALDGLGARVGVGESIWPHGRWRLDFTGRADHAGTTRLADRRDPMLPYASTVLAAREAAQRLGALATISKVAAVPGGVNGICLAVRAWLDARAPDEDSLRRLVDQVTEGAREAAGRHQVTVTIARESFTPVVEFDHDLRERVVGALARHGVIAPVLPTGAGHDAGVLAAALPTAMLFVRNPAGVSHSPAEYAEPADCEAGVAALAIVLEELACR
jgi:beta-ureidopropionase / N-carbamoyl-L-amino-acid hydrolase